jgi:hypothetical protein
VDRNVAMHLTDMHCEHLTCSARDFLPFRCKACSRMLCLEHRSALMHNCAGELDQSSLDCPICGRSVIFNRARGGDDANVVWERHYLTECTHEAAKPVAKRLCPRRGCTTVFNSTGTNYSVCTYCRVEYCRAHLVLEDHACPQAALARAPAAATAATVATARGKEGKADRETLLAKLETATAAGGTQKKKTEKGKEKEKEKKAGSSADGPAEKEKVKEKGKAKPLVEKDKSTAKPSAEKEKVKDKEKVKGAAKTSAVSSAPAAHSAPSTAVKDTPSQSQRCPLCGKPGWATFALLEAHAAICGLAITAPASASASGRGTAGAARSQGAPPMAPTVFRPSADAYANASRTTIPAPTRARSSSPESHHPPPTTAATAAEEEDWRCNMCGDVLPSAVELVAHYERKH